MSYPLLSQISSPEQIKHFSLESLKLLAVEIRQKIIDVMAVNGGHLASNLGIVELMIALHYVFDSPSDKFIFDVSHQSYPHKLLTGRYHRFDQVRKFKGLCGFCNPKESKHDHFYAGHAGTALSLGLGVAKNRDANKRKEHVLPIIGDATLTCGLTLEALNNIPRDLKDFIVVLNDNEMSISENVGAMKYILSRFFNHPRSNKIYHEVESLLSKFPGLGTQLAKQGHKLKESLKNLFSTAPFFEQFHLDYVGPVNGHDINKLILVLEALKNNPHPVLLHILTVKGQGMETATLNPVSWHGCKPFDKETEKFLTTSSQISFPQVFGKHILEMAKNDPSLIAVTPAMPAGSCLQEFMKIFPERCLDVGIAEGHAVTFCGGIAYGKKMKVVCSIYATFLQRAFDNLFHDVCLQELPIVFAIDRAGISGPDGSTHHGIYDISFLNAMPNMVICQPRNAQLLKELLESSFSWGLPTAIRYPNMATEETDAALKIRPLGIGEIVVTGNKLAIIAVGHMCYTAIKVRELLLPYGIDATIVDPIFLKPLDQDLLYSILTKHTYIVTLEEHSMSGGFASIFNQFIVRNKFYQSQVLNLGIPEAFIEQGSYRDLMQSLNLSPEAIAEQIKKEFFPFSEQLNPSFV